jgi:hypothetical protein
MDFQWPAFNNNFELDKRRQTESADARFFKKPFYMPSGKAVMVQGSEDKALRKLLQKYNETDIIVEDAAIENAIGRIFYKGLDGKTHRYYPDIYIRSANMIVEVKSSYTYKIQEKTNKLKEAACIAANFRFKFMIM